MVKTVKFDKEKLKAVILHTCANCDPTQLGAVKLHKVLYFADMLHYAAFGTSITGSTYRKRPFGPTNDHLLPALRELEAEGKIKIRSVDYFGYRKTEYIYCFGDDKIDFANCETALLNDIIELVCLNNTAKTISELSHMKPWEMVDFGDEIPYHSALNLIPAPVSQEAIQAASMEIAAIESQRSSQNTVDFKVFSDFRNRILSRRTPLSEDNGRIR